MQKSHSSDRAAAGAGQRSLLRREPWLAAFAASAVVAVAAFLAPQAMRPALAGTMLLLAGVALILLLRQRPNATDEEMRKVERLADD